MEAKNKFPVLSVIIPAHNEGAALTEAVASVRAQNYAGEVEIIVACNGCADDSAAVARATGARVEESEKSGMSFGKNLGGRVAKGEILLFLDADSRLDAGALEKMARVCAERGPRLVGTMRGYLYDSPTLWERGVLNVANIAQYLRRLPSISGAIFIDRQTYQDIGGFDENIPQGTSSDLALRATAAGAGWIYLWGALAYTSPRRFRKVGMVRQLLSWMVNVRLLKTKRTDKLSERDYENIR